MFRRIRQFNKSKSAKKRTKDRLRPETTLLIKQIAYGVFSVLVVIGVVWGVWHLTRLPFVTISAIEVTGGYTISHDEVRAIAKEVMDGEYLKLIPYTFSFSYPQEKIKNRISELDKLKTVTIEKPTLNTLSIYIEEYIPYALWCKEREDGVCFFIDNDGIAFSQSPSLSGSAFLRYRSLGREPKHFDTLVDSGQLQTVQLLVKTLEDSFGFAVLTVELDMVGDIFLILRGGSEIKVSKLLTVEETLRNLEAVLSAPEFVDLEPGDFPYIDLRFGNKVFVSDEWPIEETIATSSTALEIETEVARDEELEAVVPDTVSVTEATLVEDNSNPETEEVATEAVEEDSSSTSTE